MLPRVWAPVREGEPDCGEQVRGELTFCCTSEEDAEPSGQLLMAQAGCPSSSRARVCRVNTAREAGTALGLRRGRADAGPCVCPVAARCPAPCRASRPQRWQQQGTTQPCSPSHGWQRPETRAGSVPESSPKITPQSSLGGEKGEGRRHLRHAMPATPSRRGRLHPALQARLRWQRPQHRRAERCPGQAGAERGRAPRPRSCRRRAQGSPEQRPGCSHAGAFFKCRAVRLRSHRLHQGERG